MLHKIGSHSNSTMMLLRCLIIQAILFSWHVTPVLCADKLGYCQKSGCRTASDPVPLPDKKLRSSTSTSTTSKVTQPRPNFAILMVEWIVVFFFLRIFLYIRLNGCRPFQRRFDAFKSSIAFSFDHACKAVIHQISGVRGSSARRARARPTSSGNGRAAPRGSGLSLGSLADLLGLDDDITEGGGSSYASSYTGDFSYDSESQSSASYTTNFSESESDITSPIKRARKGGGGKGGGGRDGDSTVSSVDPSTLASYLEASEASTATSLLAAKNKKAATGNQSKKKYYASDDGTNDSYTTGSDYTVSSAEGYSSTGSIVHKFMDYLVSSTKKKKRDTSPPEGGGHRRRPSFDHGQNRRSGQRNVEHRRRSLDLDSTPALHKSESSSKNHSSAPRNHAAESGIKMRYAPARNIRGGTSDQNHNGDQNGHHRHGKPSSSSSHGVQNGSSKNKKTAKAGNGDLDRSNKEATKEKTKESGDSGGSDSFV
mmetsp:Transcript_25008/g.42844  ORF Transcript_25008/g.42844 Transcript_25008/m.42844 type:complete len:483 (+) Transcript_25008:312-1760(+)